MTTWQNLVYDEINVECNNGFDSHGIDANVSPSKNVLG